jgi:adenylate cyclase
LAGKSNKSTGRCRHDCQTIVMPEPFVTDTQTERPIRDRLRLRFRDKLALWFGAVVLVSTLLAIALSYYTNLHRLIDQFGTSLVVIANAGAAHIDPDTFKSLQTAEQMGSRPYADVRAQLLSARTVADKSGVPLRFLYTMAPTDKPETWRYVVDSQLETLADGKENPDFSALGETEDFPPTDVIRECYRTGLPAADRDVREYPHWGPLLSVAVPIRDRTGRIVGVLGADAPATAVSALRNQLKQTAFICLCVGMIVVLTGSSLVAYQVTRPINTLVAATERIATGDLTTEVTIPGHDELSQLGDAFNKMTAGLRLRDLYKHQFERYVSRQIADTILANPERDFWHGERRKATILFSDIRGFTAMSEKLEPEEVVQRLNDYLGVMVDIVFAYDGTLDKFIGDSIMAVFGAPVNMGNDEERAILAAVAMQEAVVRLEKQWSETGKVGFKIGIGVHTGPIVVGNIGSDQRLEYAAIGDTVNLASRLEGLNKDYNTGILISEETYRHVDHLVEVRWVDKVAVRGRTEPVDLYEVLRLKAGATLTPPSAA